MESFLGLPVGLLLGVVVHRGDFCMHSALREVLAGRPGSQMRTYLTALGLQLAAVNLLVALGVLALALPPVIPVAAMIGGAVFGVGMVMAKG